MGAPGFDDAPVVRLRRAQRKRVTYIYPYYCNPQFLRSQVERWRQYPCELREMLSAVVVDDGSPSTPAADVLRGIQLPFELRLFRIEVDVRWNWLAARNIAMKHAVDGWCLMTDMDHVVPAETADAVIHEDHDPRVIYRFQRREANGARIHPHPNSMLMTRKMFWKVGGYDEALSGHYGTDGDWRRRCVKAAKVQTLPQELERHEYETDSSTTTYKRKQPEDAGKRAILAARGPGWRPKILSFPYHEVRL